MEALGHIGALTGQELWHRVLIDLPGELQRAVVPYEESAISFIKRTCQLFPLVSDHSVATLTLHALPMPYANFFLTHPLLHDVLSLLRFAIAPIALGLCFLLTCFYSALFV